MHHNLKTLVSWGKFIKFAEYFGQQLTSTLIGNKVFQVFFTEKGVNEYQ